ncbi:ABC transporter permease [Hymenobacter cellulosilyticus]|uniref:ABC transporter permease n=1 Tax=Hymenobacter cellulosilyticus TaxID=2932248 RepID=A0A8T9Q434_9BACT|nr:ABC transporter permease [Hymenobacter cellulosilyticus]UOQ72334.1 ABC transporter permease [Hymenobacter cellulosilyticus]
MGRFLFIRLLRTLPTAWGILSIIFLLSRLLASNQLRLSELQGSALGGHALTAAQLRSAEFRLQQRLGLDLPLFYLTPAPTSRETVAYRWQWNGWRNQYHLWLRSMVRGDLGRSFRDNQPVTSLLGRTLVSTLALTSGAFLLTIGTAYSLAIGLSQARRWRSTLLAILHLLQGLPLFVVALLLLLLLANPDLLDLFPAYGLAPSEPAQSWLTRWLVNAHHLVLPWLSLTLVSLPAMVVQLDTSLQHELQQNYSTTARAKGLAHGQVMRRHALRNALLPSITQITDLLPALVAGAVVVELIFAVPGMGRALAEAAAARDFPVLLGGVLLVALVRLLSQILADWLYYQADPRIQLET